MATPLSRRLRTTLFYALRTAFRLTPMPQGARDRLRERFLDTKGHWVPEGPKGQAPTGELPRRPYVRSDERAIGYVPYEKGELPDPLPATLVAFYLPQFHTIPENDEWWGKGFTEWRNVTRALPQFEGHYQPKLPGDLGFYDLRNVEVMHEQARLAREYGISAFCFYFYWFGGKTLLETPLRNWLNDKTIDLKFCLCWANEKWTRTWDGRGDEILIDQKHSPEDDIAFIEHVAEYMRDPRYLRVDGKPVLLIYRPSLLPDAKSSASRWREWCEQNGIGSIHIAYVQGFERPAPVSLGFDSAVQFPPNGSDTSSVSDSLHLINPDYRGNVLDWRDMANQFIDQKTSSYVLHAAVNCGWDNEARRSGQGRCYLFSSPSGYRDWISRVARATDSVGMGQPIFINAWNEWAEGACLEPDARFGYAYLNATREAQTLISGVRKEHHSSCVAIIHAWYPEILKDILISLSSSGRAWRIVATTTVEKELEVASILAAFPFTWEVSIHPNRGRDILPFLHTAKRLAAEGVDVVLKLHTKRSPHRHDGDDWRNDILEKLIASEHSNSIPDAFSRDPLLGLVAPAGHVQPLSYFWGMNEQQVRFLCGTLGLNDKSISNEEFVSGSMFWMRLGAITPLIESGIRDEDFAAESGQTDGTLAHGFERIFMMCVKHAGFHVADTETVRGVAHVPRSARYPFASSRRPT